MFNVGDFIKGLPGAPYSITNENIKKGEVVGVIGDNINVKIVEHADSRRIGYVYYGVGAKHFAPYQGETITINYTGDAAAAHKELTEKIKALSIRKATPERIQKAKDLIAEIFLDLVEGKSFYAYPVYFGDCPGTKTVICRMLNSGGSKVGSATANCAEGDEPNVWIGRAVALCKAVGRKLPDWV